MKIKHVNRNQKRQQAKEKSKEQKTKHIKYTENVDITDSRKQLEEDNKQSNSTHVSVVTGSNSHKLEQNREMQIRQINNHLFSVSETNQKLSKENQNYKHSLKLMQKLVYFVLYLSSVEFQEKRKHAHKM